MGVRRACPHTAGCWEPKVSGLIVTYLQSVPVTGHRADSVVGSDGQTVALAAPAVNRSPGGSSRRLRRRLQH